MNNRLLRVIVLLLSITGAGAYVWFSSQHNKPSPASPQEKTVELNDSEPSIADEEIETIILPSSKSAPIFNPENAKDFIELVPAPSPLLPKENIITDEEVQERWDILMSSSKSGLVISEEDIGKIMEKEAEEKDPFGQLPAKQPEE
ncbi:MAG: hypothetical protein NWT08_06475 [Akkermansiaceae bacterium]|jgi:hypothetical protein|nr:hypothetical protein [Akkermansiaceae bacterium]MDP4645614.1 hypothetical protein [Akkermansiaceae bacterium]MDP4722167.1 hypothetical protein [Akkermansiaceae bacterium]MDP4780838.1 hypothetical protein [Akkermansiaceae bacterium]MDP4848412.1 hypothetical protein [Akkermansiaceae bacterium]